MESFAAVETMIGTEILIGTERVDVVIGLVPAQRVDLNEDPDLALVLDQRAKESVDLIWRLPLPHCYQVPPLQSHCLEQHLLFLECFQISLCLDSSLLFL